MMASFAVSASATAFSDADKINADYQLAVDALTGMKVIGGYSDGSFRPTDAVSRGAFAKMVAFVVNGGKNPTTSYATSAALAFSDVKASATLAPSIGYAVAKGYISGYADGTFRSSNKVTGLAAAKILLGALGFDGVYTGTGWDINVLSDGEDAGLFAGLDTVDFTKALTREEAAQMIWNALNYSAKGETVEYVVKNGSNVVYKGTDALTALALSGISGNTLTTQNTTTDSLGFTKFGLTKDTIADDFGRKSVAYTNGKSGDDLVVFASVNPTAVLTYTTATTQGKIAAALGATAAKSVTLNISTNGGAASSATANKTTTTAIGGAGTLIEVYKTTTANTYDVVVIETFVKQLAKADITAAKAATATTDAVKASIEVESGLSYETDAFKVDDVVLYTKGEASGTMKVVNVVKADYVTGEITAVGASNAYVRVDGAQKTVSAKSSLTIGTTSGVKQVGDKGTYYLDTYGNIIFYSASTEVVADQYIYVIEAKSAAAKAEGGSDLFGTGASTTAAKAQAQVIDLTTGEIKIVDLAIVKNTAGEDVYATRTGAASSDKVTDTTIYTTAGIYKYAEVNGAIALGSKTPETGASVTVKKNTAAVGTDIATSATVLTVVEFVKTGTKITSAKVTTYNGIANFPTTATYTGAIVTKNATTNVISSILVVKEYAESSAANYAVFKGDGETDADGTKAAFYVGGSVVEYYKESGTPETGYSVSFTADKVYDILVKNGKVQGKEQTAVASAKTLTVVDSTFVTDGSDYWYLTENCVVVDKNADYATTTLVAGDKVTVYGADANHIAFIVVDNT